MHDQISTKTPHGARPATSSARRAGPNPKSGPPAKAAKQRLRVLQLLRQTPEGISKEAFQTPTELGGYGISQVGARIHELEKAGFVFEHRPPRKDSGERFVRYFLLSEPIEPGRAPRSPEHQPGRKPPTADSAQSGLFETSPRPSWGGDPDSQRRGTR